MISIQLEENEPKKLLSIQIKLISYSLSIHKTKTEAAKFLGISRRCLLDWINKNEDLHKFRGNLIAANFDNEKWNRYAESKLWKTKKVEDLIKRKL